LQGIFETFPGKREIPPFIWELQQPTASAFCMPARACGPLLILILAQLGAFVEA
jgi:hypothetical protein